MRRGSVDVLAGPRKRYQIATLTLALLVAPVSVCVSAAPRPVELDDLDGVRLGQAVVLATMDLSPDARVIAVERGLRLRVVDASSGAILSDLAKASIRNGRREERSSHSIRTARVQFRSGCGIERPGSFISLQIFPAASIPTLRRGWSATSPTPSTSAGRRMVRGSFLHLALQCHRSRKRKTTHL